MKESFTCPYYQESIQHREIKEVLAEVNKMVCDCLEVGITEKTMSRLFRIKTMLKKMIGEKENE